VPASVSADLWSWLLAVLPIVLLVVLVLRSRWTTAVKALLTAAVAIVIGAVAFGAGPQVLGVGIGKGVWTGIWILYVIWPALLLYHVAARAGLDRMGGVFANVLPRDVENVLLVAWVFPSFIQGVAGFGTPIAVAAPLLLAMGVRPVLAVALPLVGYHWSVTFGSMGSSFYMGALTAGIGAETQAVYATDAALILGVNMLVSGVLVCLLHGGLDSLRRGARMLAITGGAMFLALNLVVRVEPAVGSLAAGAAGLATVLVLRSRRARSPQTSDTVLARVPVGAGPVPPSAAGGSEDRLAGPRGTDGPDTPRRPLVVLLPYAYLLLLVLAVFLPAASRSFVKEHLLIGPSFPATETSLGVANEAVASWTPIALLGHPGTYILLSAVLGYLTYRWTRIWPEGELRGTVRSWVAQARRSSLSVIALAVLATVMVDTGMVRTIAEGAAAVTGALFPAVSPVIGAIGSFTTGSTTTSNALFSALQRDVAHLIQIDPAHLLAAQTTGGNIGNSLAPVVMLIGVTAVGAEDDMDAVFRRVAPSAGVLMLVAIALTFLMIALR
jgi:lactate permease